MATAQIDDHSWMRTLRRLLSVFPVEWLPALFDLIHALFRWFTARHDGLYEILSYESALELADVKGRRATVRKRQRVRFLQNDIAAFQDIVYGDGSIFESYDVSPGIAADRYREGDRWHVLISLRATKNRGDVEDFLLTRRIQDGFTHKEEWWEVELRHPTRWLRLSIVFPKGRPCRGASLTQRSRHRTQELGPECFSTLPDGRQQLHWETRNVQSLEVYTIRWSW